MKQAPIGIRCFPIKLDDGSYAVMSRPGSKGYSEGKYFGRTKFQVVPGDGGDVIVAERPQDEAAQIATRESVVTFPWTPTITVTFQSRDSVFTGFPDIDISPEWSIEAEPLFYPDSSLEPVYGVGAFYHIKIVIGGTTVLDSDKYAGDSGTEAWTGPYTSPVLCTATLTHGTTVLDEVTFTF